RWILAAAKQGDKDGAFYAGHNYYFGNGCIQHYSEALQWFKLAASKPHPKAQYFLSYMYYIGKGVDKNFVEASNWSNIASACATEDDFIYTDPDLAQKSSALREDIERRMSKKEVELAQDLSKKWLETRKVTFAS